MAIHHYLCWKHVAEVVAFRKGGLEVGKGAREFSFEERPSVHADDDGFVKIHQLVVEVEGELGVVTLGDVDGVALEGEVDGLAALELVGRGGEPVEMRMGDVLLSPDDVGGVGVALVLLQPRKGCGIFKIHPVRLPFDDVGLVEVTIGIGLMKGVEFHTSLGAFLVAVVGGIEGAAPHHEGGVAKIEEGDIAWMTCHHGGSRPSVSHTGSHSPHTIAACGVANQIDFIGVHIKVCHTHLDEGGVELVEVWLEPHIPVIVRGAGCKIDAVLGFVKLFLVLPLAVVELGGSVAASMQGDEEAVAVGRFCAVGGVPERHDLGADNEVTVLPDLLVFGLDVLLPLDSKGLRFLLCLRPGEVLGREGDGKEGKEKGENVLHVYSSMPVAFPLVVSSIPLGLMVMSCCL